MIDGFIAFAKNHWAILTATVTAVTSIGGWIVTAIKWHDDHKKQQLDHQKLKFEVRKIIGEQLEKLHAYDTAHRETDKRFAECNREFFQLFRDNAADCAKLEAAREAICGALVDLIHRYIIYFDFFCHVYQDEPTRLESLIDNTIRDIGIWKRTQENINHDKVLCKFGNRPEPFRISRHTLDPLRHTVKPLGIPVGPKDLINAELDLLLNAGHALAWGSEEPKDSAA